MKLFITGATGFIGKHLIRRLKRTPHTLNCLVRKMSDCRELESAGARIFHGDVLDRHSILAAMEGCEWVVHLANFYEFWSARRDVYLEVNIAGTRNVLEAALATGAAKVVHVSSIVTYGNAAWPVTEERAMGDECASEYSRTKRAGEMLAWKLHAEEHLPLVVIYPGAVIGPDDPKATGRYIRNFLRRRMPAQVLRSHPFPFVHVRDVADAIVRALEKDGNIGEKYLIVSESLTFAEINNMLSAISGIHAPRMVLPDPLVMLSAHLMTGIANVLKKPPILDLSVDQMREMKQGMKVDGSKSARELGLVYTPIRAALEGLVGEIRRK